MVMLYETNNHCLEGREQVFFEPTAAVHKHDNLNYFMLKKRTLPIDYCQLLSDVYTYGTA